MGECLKKHLSSLISDDLFRIRKSEVVNFFSNAETQLHVFSLEIVDLYYSLPHTEIRTAVKDSLDKQMVDFQNSLGISSNNCLELLAFHLKPMFVVDEGKTFSQKEWVFIGSGVTPL